MKFIKLTEEKKQLIILTVIGVLILFLDLFFVLKPQITSLFRLFPQIQKLNTDIKLASKDAASIDNLSKYYYGLKEKSDAISRKIIFEEQLPLLLEDIAQLANKNNIKIMEISPVRDPKAKEVATISSKEKLYPFSILIEAASSYHKLGKFLNEIDNLERFLKVYNFEITPSPGDYLRHRVKLTLGTFVIRK